MRSLPTSVGTAPKFAASKNTNTELTTKPVTITWAAVSRPSAAATGTDARTTALTRSHATISRCRFTRSARAPARSPNSR